MQKVVVWIVALIVVAIAIYYFAFVYEKANYQHPMRRTSDISQPHFTPEPNLGVNLA